MFPCYRDLADNKVFFQHPDLMRALGVHETVMTLMVNTLNKAQQQSSAADIDTSDQKRRSSIASNSPDADKEGSEVQQPFLYIVNGNNTRT